MSYDDAVAAVTAPGQRYETDEVVVDGITQTVFKNIPPSLRELFGTWAGRGDTTFIVYEDERLSFADVAARVAAAGAALVERYGVQPGDRVAIAMRNLPEWVVTFAAATSIGAVSVSLNAWWTEDELDFGLEDSGATVLVADPERVERTRAACARLGVATIGVRLPAGEDVEGVDRWEDVVVLGRALPDIEVRPEHDATILYTSGTTGRPKGAVSTHRAVLQALAGFGCKAAVSRLRSPAEAKAASALPPVFILIVPLFHVTGCIPVFLSCASSGLGLVMMHKWEPVRGARADRAREGHELRRGAHAVVGSPRVPALLGVRHVEPGQCGWGRGAGATRAREAGGLVVQPGPSDHRLRHDRDQRVRAAELR